RLNWIKRETLPADVESPAYRQLLERIRKLGWQVEIYLEGPKLATVLPRLRGQGVKVVVDHFGVRGIPGGPARGGGGRHVREALRALSPGRGGCAAVRGCAPRCGRAAPARV